MAQIFRCFIDTYSWKKIDYLHANGWKSLMEALIVDNDILLTREVVNELEYRDLKIVTKHDILQYVTILPKIHVDYQRYEKLGFDPADASLIEYSKKAQTPVVTEDHPMIALAVIDKIDFIQLIDFFSILNVLDQVTNNQVFKLVKVLRKLKNITSRKERSILATLG